jgi:hypothetical protein
VALAAALERIARRTPARAPRWPLWPLVPGLAAAVTFAVMLSAAPAAWAAVAATPSLRPPVPTEADLRATLRPLLIAHITALLAGYVLFFVVWAVTQLEVVLGLFGVSRWRAGVARWGPRGVAGGVALWAMGAVLGGVWASYVMGRFWGWDPVEVQALFVLAAGGAWLALAWRWRDGASLAPAWSALLFWVLLDLIWGGLHWLLVPARSYPLQPAVIRFFVAGVFLNVLLLASAWYAERRRKIVEGPGG